MANSKNHARQAVAKAQAAVKAPTVAAKQPARVLETVKPAAVTEPTDFIGRVAKVVGGKKNKDENVSVFHVPAKPNRFGAINAVCIDQDGERVYINVKYLEDTGTKMDAKLLKKLQDERQAEADATVFVAAFVNTVMDKKTGNPKSVQLRNSGWFSPIYFGVNQFTATNAALDNGMSISEVPAWMIRVKCGQDALDKVLEHQDEYTKLVNAAG